MTMITGDNEPSAEEIGKHTNRSYWLKHKKIYILLATKKNISLTSACAVIFCSSGKNAETFSFCMTRLFDSLSCPPTGRD